MQKISRTKKGIIISILAGILNLILSLVKLAIGLIAGSLSVLYDGFNNLSDVFSSGAAAIGFGVAGMKRNKNYPNGYGRIEYIISFLISVVVVIIGVAFIIGAIERLLVPQPIGFSWIYFYILLATVFVKLFMALGYRRYNKSLMSPMFEALQMDSVQDAGITSLVVLSFVLSQYIGFPVDAVCGLIMAAIIIINCVKLIIKSFHALMGGNDIRIGDSLKRFVESYESIEKVREIVLYDFGYDNIYGCMQIETDKKINQEDIIVIIQKIKEDIHNKYDIKMNIDIAYQNFGGVYEKTKTEI
ncbi:MAG: cation diffusion facilitator family transporter [Bacillota bacterium]